MPTVDAVLALAMVLGSPPAAIVLEDPAGDDVGAGGLVYPSGGDYRRGDFDLRKVEVIPRGEVVELRVTVGAPVRRYVSDKRTNASDLELTNGIYVQNVDVYIDTIAGAGFAEAVPGRRIELDPGWDVAVVLTPQPYKARAAIASAMSPGAAARVVVADGLAAEGNTIVARVAASALGGAPSADWGYAVVLTGASWRQSFELVPRLAGSHAASVFTMPVLGVAEREAFGGGELGDFDPYVVDLVAPPGRTQREILSSYDERSRRYARVPMVYPGGAPPPQASPAPSAAVEASVPTGPRVISIQDEWIVISRPKGEVERFGLAAVLAEDGEVAARVVVTKVEDDFVVAQIVDARAPVTVGARVRFGSNQESENKP